MKRYCISLLIIIIACVSGSAQEELSKEITIDREFVPIEQKASKSNMLPEVYRPQTNTQAGNISYSDWAIPSEVPTSAITLSPYNFGTTYEVSQYRGYFEYSIGTSLNMLGSAGYRIIDFDRTKLNIWLQHNSTWTGKNKSKNSPHAIDQHWNDNVLGIDFLHRFRRGALSTNAFFHYSNFNYFGRAENAWYATDSTQSVNEFRIDIGWAGPFHEDEGLNYSFNAIYNYFSFSNDIFYPIHGNSENHLKLKFNAEFASSEFSHIGLNINYDFINYTIHHQGINETSIGHENLGLFNALPYYAYRSGRLSFKLGINLDVSFNDGAIFRIAPHAEFRYDMLRGLQFFVEAHGRKMVNTLSRMFSFNRYISPQTLPTNSYTPLDVYGGFKIGPFAGFNATIYGGWAKVKNAMMPTLYVNPSTQENTINRSISRYTVLDMKGWRAGGEIAYAFRTLANASISLEYSPQEGNKGYVVGDDRAELVLNANVVLHPIKTVTINIGYQNRSNRSVIFNDNNGVWLEQDLGDVNYLMIGGTYRMNDIVGFMLQFDNILNKRWDTYYGMGSQPIGVLGGVSLLF